MPPKHYHCGKLAPAAAVEKGAIMPEFRESRKKAVNLREMPNIISEPALLKGQLHCPFGMDGCSVIQGNTGILLPH